MISLFLPGLVAGGVYSEDQMRKSIADLLRSAGMGDKFEAKVKVSADDAGVVSIVDEGEFLIQYLLLGPEKAVDVDIVIDEKVAVRPSVDKVVIITHGWLDKSYNDWPADVAGAIGERTDPNDWLCGYFDWKGGAKVVNPVDAARYARDIAGVRLAKAVLEMVPDVKKLRHVHLVAHSAGCWAVDSAASLIAKQTDARVHITFLDAYVPQLWAEKALGAATAEKTGRAWAEHYYSRDITFDVTQADLSNAHNVDLTEVDRGFAQHEFPYRWYYATITGRFRKTDWEKNDKVITKIAGVEYGFARSAEAGEKNYQKSTRLKKANSAVKLKQPKQKNIFDISTWFKK